MQRSTKMVVVLNQGNSRLSLNHLFYFFIFFFFSLKELSFNHNIMTVSAICERMRTCLEHGPTSSGFYQLQSHGLKKHEKGLRFLYTPKQSICRRRFALSDGGFIDHRQTRLQASHLSNTHLPYLRYL